jgi:hypothetical protein
MYECHSQSRELRMITLGATVQVLFKLTALAFFLLQSNQPAYSRDLVFRIIEVPDSPLAGRIWINDGNGYRKFRDVPATGILKVKNYKCLPNGEYFTASVFDTKLTFDDETKSELDCSLGERPFRFREKSYTAILDSVVTGRAIASVPTSAKLLNWQNTLEDAYAVNNTELVLKRSAQISEYLRKRGFKVEANSYNTLNFDTAKSKISGPHELYFDPKRESFFLSNKDEEKIKSIQANSNIRETGKLDWKTMESVSKLGNPYKYK